jgi:tetratricopeptide (TPR) repeat protein
MFEDTPSAVGCRTISEINSPIHSPSYLIGSPNPSASGNTPIAHNSQIQSPTISVAHTLRSQDRTFPMPNPLEFYQSFANIASRLAPSAYAALDQPKVAEEVQEDRCRRLEEENLRRELHTARYMYGPGHTESLNVLYRLGVVLLHQGRYQSAATVAHTLIENCSMLDSHKDSCTLKAEHLLGQIYIAQGHYGQAEELFRRISDCRKSALGDEHPSTMMSMQNLAIVYSLQGRALESEKIGVHLVETRRQTLGDKNSATLTSINHLATVHTRQGRYKEAEEALTYVRNTRTIMLGGRHPDTLTSINNLGIVYYHQGKLEDADVLLRHAVKIQKEVLGERHPDTLSTMSNLEIIFGESV